jgi:replicative DNA helicase
MGKSALAVNIATNAAVHAAVPTLLMSLEMSRLELADRMLSSRADVPLFRMQRGNISPDERRQLVSEAAEIGQSPLMIDDTPSRSIMDVCATARRLKRKNKLGLVVIDYLQLIEPEDRKAVREQQVASISRKLKALARLLKIPVLVLAQLNRLMENRPNKRPRLSDLRESGSIEQDADVVLFVHREEYYLQPKEVAERKLEGVAEIIVAKQRNGPTGTVVLNWRKEYTRFEDREQGGTPWDPDQPYVQDPF